ncbi:MAG: hypothetical protein M1835_007615 [Candelina submexicana]|nr:MAG: hypothetical protein M1835_007615 [Candelina submexicana]
MPRVWAKTLKAHTDSNAPLQTGWAGAVWARAAEIVRYSGAGWVASDVTAFENLLHDVYLPEVIVGSNSNGDWELVMMEAAIDITVFLSDGSSYDKAMANDGSYPKAAPGSGLMTRDDIVKYWHNQATFPENGIAQETCRDFVHTGYGISSISHVAETSRILGNNLYTGDVGT